MPEGSGFTDRPGTPAPAHSHYLLSGEEGNRTLCCGLTNRRVAYTPASPFWVSVVGWQVAGNSLPPVTQQQSTTSYTGQDSNLYDPLRRRGCFHYITSAYTRPRLRTRTTGFGDLYASQLHQACMWTEQDSNLQREVLQTPALPLELPVHEPPSVFEPDSPDYKSGASPQMLKRRSRFLCGNRMDRTSGTRLNRPLLYH